MDSNLFQLFAIHGKEQNFVIYDVVFPDDGSGRDGLEEVDVVLRDEHHPAPGSNCSITDFNIFKGLFIKKHFQTNFVKKFFHSSSYISGKRVLYGKILYFFTLIILYVHIHDFLKVANWRYSWSERISESSLTPSRSSEASLKRRKNIVFYLCIKLVTMF